MVEIKNYILKLKMNPQTPDNEVARLRGLLKDHATFLRKNGFDRQADDLMRFAPAPEEPVDKGEISDGYHTFNELYDHRCTLFLALLQRIPSMSWISKKHDDGSSFDGWFIAGMRLPSGDVTYHLPEKMWDLAVKTGAELRNFAPKWDGHKSPDVVIRLQEWIKLAAYATQQAQVLQMDAAPCKHSDDVNCRSCHVGEVTGEVKEPAPEWRDLGQDEVIQDGDEVKWKGGAWGKAQSSIGYKAGYWEGNKVARTRRPLPKQEEMPLEKEIWGELDLLINRIYQCGTEKAVFCDVSTCLHILRDEIQKLKEAR
jgi:hypothetical protein